MTGECLSHEALADFTRGSFTGSRIRGWWWPQRYQVRISGNWMLPYLEKNLCRCVKNLWWDVYPGLCPWARNPVSNLLRKEIGTSSRVEYKHTLGPSISTPRKREKRNVYTCALRDGRRTLLMVLFLSQIGNTQTHIMSRIDKWETLFSERYPVFLFAANKSFLFLEKRE